MTCEPKSRAGLPSDAGTRQLVERARRLRAETLARLARAAWSRIASRPAGAPAGVPVGAPAGAPIGAMPHARA